MTDIARHVLDILGLDPETFSQLALQAAGESQKATAIPALVAVASLSLLVVLVWVAAIRFAWRGLRA